MKIELILKPCPWCKKTPDIWMPIEDDTWCWKIMCINTHCRIKPSTAHVSIRKSAKTNFWNFHDKLEKIVCGWNYGNEGKPYEKKLIDLEELPELNISAENLCAHDPWFRTIYLGNGEI
jgi:hypothetical protein